MAVMSLRTFPVTPSRAPPTWGEDFSRQRGTIIALSSLVHETVMTEELDRILQTRAGRRVEYLGITRTSPGSDYRRYGRHTRRQRCLIGFGADSIIEVASSCVLLWWLAEGSIESRSRGPSIGRRLLFCACRLHRNWRLCRTC